jgi:predicted secreted protein
MRISTSIPVLMMVSLFVSLIMIPLPALYMASGTCHEMSAVGLANAKSAIAVDSSSPVWNWTYGGANMDWGCSVIETSTGGFAAVGYTESSGAGDSDVWLILTDESGDPQSSHTFGGVDRDIGWGIIEVSSGGFLIVGETESFGAGDFDAWLIRVDANGNHLWNQTYGGLYDEWGWTVVEVSTGGFVFSGRTSSLGAGSFDVWLVRTDSNGNHIWNHTFGGIDIDAGRGMVELSTGGFAIIGQTASFGAGFYDFYLIRTDADGNLVWSRTYGGTGLDEAASIAELSTGGFVLTGDTFSYGAGSSDVWLIRTDANGNSLWNRTFGGADADGGMSVIEMSSGGYAITGETASLGAGGADLWLIRTNADGIASWNQIYGGSDDDEGWAVIETSTGDLVIFGKTASFGAGQADAWLIQVTEEVALPPFPLELLFLIVGVVIIVVIIVVVIVVIRRRRSKPRKRRRKS